MKGIFVTAGTALGTFFEEKKQILMYILNK